MATCFFKKVMAFVHLTQQVELVDRSFYSLDTPGGVRGLNKCFIT